MAYGLISLKQSRMITDPFKLIIDPFKSPQSSKFARQSNSGHNFDGVVISEFVKFSSQKNEIRKGGRGKQNLLNIRDLDGPNNHADLIGSVQFS